MIDNQPLASLRVSFGASSTFSDALGFLQFLRTFFVDPFTLLPPLPPLPTATSATTQQTKIVGLTIYPIKSCGGFSVKEWPIGPTGLVLDRRWVVVDEGGRAVTQKRCGKMCLVRVVGVDLGEGWVEIEAGGRGRKRIAVDDGGGGRDVMTRVCGDR